MTKPAGVPQTHKQKIATEYNYQLFKLKGMIGNLSSGYDVFPMTQFSEAIYDRENAILEKLAELEVLYKLHRDALIAQVNVIQKE